MTHSRLAGATTRRRTRASTPSGLRRHLAPGVTAGAIFLAVEMLIGSLTTTTWAFPEAVAHTLHIGAPGYHLEPGVLASGASVHLAVSAALGAVFTVIVDQLRISGARVIVAAWLFSGVETAVAIWGVLHTLLPATLPQLLNSIPLWASILGHNLYGLLLGLLLLTHDRHSRRTASPLHPETAGQQENGDLPSRWQAPPSRPKSR